MCTLTVTPRDHGHDPPPAPGVGASNRTEWGAEVVRRFVRDNRGVRCMCPGDVTHDVLEEGCRRDALSFEASALWRARWHGCLSPAAAGFMLTSHAPPPHLA